MNHEQGAKVYGSTQCMDYAEKQMFSSDDHWEKTLMHVYLSLVLESVICQLT